MNLLNKLVELLKQEEKFVVDNKLLKNKIIESALKLDSVLIKLLLSNETFKEHFFVEIEGITIFDKDKFMKFVSNKQFLPDSYTAFKNKIGLAVGEDKYFYENREVVVNFPYKDCILVGGQDKEDTKRSEVFYNYTLAPEQVDMLIEPKVFTNVKKYSENGIEEVEEIKDTDNLIIKGNNLFALHSLKKRFAGRIKLIYIDPPYNTGNDSFKYNDSFNHSTWLTFMKNRLEVAKELLSKDGLIFVSIDDNEQAYLKVLMDEVFGRENFINNICIKSRGGISNDKIISLNHNFLLFYCKNREIVHKKRFEFGLPKEEKDFKNYNKNDNDGKGDYALNPVTGPGGASKGNPYYEFLGIKNYWRFSKDKMQKMYKEGLIVKINNSLYQKTYRKDIEEKVKKISTWWDNKDFKTSTGTNELKKLFDLKNASDFFKNPKPENLIKQILEFATNPGDIVLDYHLGSGTTAAVAHKMRRQYIGIEQMDYIENVTIERLKKVIKGELGGISKAVDWQGGGSFVYMELFELNKKFDRAITECESNEEALKIFEDMLESAILDYTFDLSKAGEVKEYIKESEISNIKKLLLSLLDPNHMYLNFSEIDDETYQVSPKDKKINKSFYKVD